MMARAKIFRFDSEAAMCAAFIKDAARQGYDAYPECGGFDIVLVNRESGWQIGVEAKQQFNAAVLHQIVESFPGRYRYSGPDFVAVLVPEGGAAGLAGIATALGVAVIRAAGEPGKNGMAKIRSAHGGYVWRQAFAPDLPRAGGRCDYFTSVRWPAHCFAEPLRLPDYVPDVAAGAPAPVTLTEWKIRAIKIVILLERRGVLRGADFKALDISPSRWTQGKWIVPEGRGRWVAGPYLPDFRAQHPRNFEEIAADFETWSATIPAPAETMDAFKAPPAASAPRSTRKAS